MANTYGDLVSDAYQEIRVARAGDVLSPDLMAFGLRTLNRLLDLWNANQRAVYCETFQDFTLVPNLSPHTIGPGGTFDVPQRPVSIEFVSVNLGGSPPALIPVNVRDAAWYANQTVPGLTNTFPTDVYYETNWPLGDLWFWGIPTSNYGVRLWMRVLLTSVAQTDEVSLPPGYEQALMLTLAEMLAPSNGQQASAATQQEAGRARAQVFGNNDPIPRLATRDSGLPSTGGWPRSNFNWRSRTFNS